MDQPFHTPVLLREAVDALQIVPGGVYVDCTLGGGGHARSILDALNEKGRLVAFDQDADAQRNIPTDKRVAFVNQNFRHLQKFLRLQNILSVDGILADLGVSSHQFDSTERGFSTRFNADLDMRMDKRQTLTAKEVIATYSEQQLHKIFEAYGEVTNAKTLARTIVAVRDKISIRSIDDLKNALRGIVKGNPNKYLAQVFQALRITVNDELGALQELLQQVPVLLKPGGRVAIITFHSLEDRLVKHFFRRGTANEPGQNPFINDEPGNELKAITKKPVIPSEKEIKENPRSRSAKLRVAEKK
ncbi:MAG TPA: 16S rRNA (cytosine(1402)-N(4))-methyltransferase RsmH [Chitinophagaceae bacterium]|nr:16S rRNA (cytosine(1402)-N(4))-methyltransferase RsmH [Chitinophagaceae bacterium]